MAVEALRPTRDGRRSPRLHNLLNDATTLADLLVDQCAAGQWLDSYLLAAGIDQILEDALHPDALALNRIANRLKASSRGAAGRAAAAVASDGRGLIWGPHAHLLGSSAVARCRRETAALAADLATLTVGEDVVRDGEESLDTGASLELRHRATRLRQKVAALPLQVRRTPLRLPSCFLNLDQCPADIRALMNEVVGHWPDRRHPTLVVGVRTSGSYLAPIAIACLKAAGYGEVRQITVRPGQLWLPEERRTLRLALGAGARVLLLDDPPNTWGTIVKTTRLLRDLGFQPNSIVPVVQTFPTTPPPPGELRAHPIVVLPWERCDIHRRLDPVAVKQTLNELLQGEASVDAVKRLPIVDHEGARAHARALYEVSVRRGGGRSEQRMVYAHGVGLGYLGVHAMAVGEPLQAFLPTLYGVAGGLLFREWLPEDLRLDASEDLDAVCEAMVDYVSTRARELRVPEDVSLRLKDRSSVWRALGRFLARPFGRVEIAFWPVTERAARALVAVDEPSVVDTRTGVSTWFRAGRRSHQLKKIAFVGRTFSGFDMYCYDPVFDLAGAAASAESDRMQERLRKSYTAGTGKAVDPERWLLYQLVHLSSLDMEWEEISDPVLERRMSRRIQRYLRDVFLDDVRPPSEGPLCAIDIDGVLESTPLGISATSAEGVRTLRALQLHGYRPVLVSGRSIAEVRDRSIHYRLAGGVGEYGAAAYVTDGDRTCQLLAAEELEMLASLRAALEQLPGVRLDDGYELAVRAYRLDVRGRRRALRPEQLEAALARRKGAPVRVIEGVAQTDFMVARADKATGLEALGAELGSPMSGRRVALAVGDTASDLPVLELAGLSFAPANADRKLREAGIPILGRSGQAGLEQAAAYLLGHRPGRCPTCRDPQLPARTRLLLTLLAPPPKPSLGAKAAWAGLTLARLAWLLRTAAPAPAATGSGGAALSDRAGSGSEP